MLDKFNSYIDQHKLCRKSDHLLLAVSGGVDSMVLMDLFHKSGYTFTVLHCNFKLRQHASDEDEKLVIKVAKKYGAKVKSVFFNTAVYAKKNKLSIQLAARELRYEWFSKQLQEKEGAKVATAHHLNDQLETIIYHLSKGAGIDGLTGIPLKAGHYFRPLLSFSRAEIMEYAMENHLEWREDASNESMKYKRNFIRHKIVPLMEEINPSLLQTFQRTSRRLKESAAIIKMAVDGFKKEYLFKEKDHYVVEKSALEDKNATFIHLMFKSFGCSYYQAEELLPSLKSAQSGSVFYTDKYTINIDRTHVYISKKEEELHEIEIHEGFEGRELSFNFEIKEAAEILLSKDSSTALLDYSKLQFPLKIRKWKEGDKFHPLGMRGQKKLSDFMIDNKIPVNLKDRQLVLESKGNIVWVVGFRIDERYKINNETSLIYKIKWLS